MPSFGTIFTGDSPRIKYSYSRFAKKRDPFSIIEGEEDFGATFGVKTVQFTWQTVAFFCYG